MAIFARSPKTRIFWKVQRGDQGKLFKNRPKSSTRFKGPRAHWRKWHYPLISMHLKCKEWKRFTRKQRFQKCPNGQVMANLRKVTQKPYFLKKCKAGTKRNFSKIAQEVPSFERFKALWSKRHYPVISIHLKCNDRKRFRRKQRLQKCKNGQDMGIFARSPKTPIF